MLPIHAILRCLLALPVTFTPQPDRATGQPAPAALDQTTETAERARWALHEAHCLAFHLCVDAPPHQCQADVVMAPGRLKTVAFIDGQWYATVLVRDGRVQEYRRQWQPDPELPDSTLHYVVLDYAAPSPAGTESVFLAPDDLACLFGTCLNSWVGPQSRRGDALRDRLAEGRYRGEDRVDGEPCYCIVCTSVNLGFSVQHQYFISKSRFMLLKWITIQDRGAGRTLKRVRWYTQIRTDGCDDDGAWSFEFPPDSPSSPATSTPCAPAP